jgi:hypothetical protein
MIALTAATSSSPATVNLSYEKWECRLKPRHPLRHPQRGVTGGNGWRIQLKNQSFQCFLGLFCFRRPLLCPVELGARVCSTTTLSPGVTETSLRLTALRLPVWQDGTSVDSFFPRLIDRGVDSNGGDGKQGGKYALTAENQRPYSTPRVSSLSSLCARYMFFRAFSFALWSERWSNANLTAQKCAECQVDDGLTLHPAAAFSSALSAPLLSRQEILS